MRDGLLAELNAFLDSMEFTRRYGFRVLEIEDGRCVMLVPHHAENDRPGGIVSGQVYMHAADVAFWLAIEGRHGVKQEYVTSSMNTAFLASAAGEDFTCHATVLKFGRRLIYGEAECRLDDRRLTHHTLTYVKAAG